ncbi:MAG: hypothetical protein Q9167_007517 [Letrouitia subvulpina]
MHKISPSEIIEIDNTYLSQIRLRKSLMHSYPDLVLGANEIARLAVFEIYKMLLCHYLPSRFPSMFRVTGPDSLKNDTELVPCLESLVTGEKVSLEPPNSIIEALRIIGGLVDEDLLFMLPTTKSSGYSLEAFVNCFPNGPSTKHRLGKGLGDIHGSVPGYQEKLRSSVNQWFERVRPGHFVKRVNVGVSLLLRTIDARLTSTKWAMTDNESLFSEFVWKPFQHAKNNDPDLDIDKIFMRCERQTLYRLPQSNSVIFSLRTCQYGLREIKAEGLGEDLARAIDGLEKGNEPRMSAYKGANVWGEAVKRFLREP